MSQAGILGSGGGGSGNVQDLTGNSGGAVGPDGANNINILGSGDITITGNPGTNTLTISDAGGPGVQTLTGDSGSATQSGNNINVLGSPSGTFTGSGSTLQYLDQTQIGPFVVDGIPGKGSYNSIQSAITAAAALYGSTGTAQTVYVRSGVYTESLTMADQVFVVGLQPGAATSNSNSQFVVRIIGEHDATAVANKAGFSNVLLESATDIISSTAVGTGTLYLIDVCLYNSTAGFTFNLPNWVGATWQQNVIQSANSSNFDSTVGNILSATYINSQIGTGSAATNLTGTVTIQNCVCTLSLVISDSIVHISNSQFFAQMQFNGTSNGLCFNSLFLDSTFPCLNFQNTATFTFYQCTFSTPVGNGVFSWGISPTIKLSGCTFPLSTQMAADTPITFDAFSYGASKNIAFADSPYIVGTFDSYLSVDSLLGPVSILMPSAPTANRIFTIKDSGLTADTNLITISAVGGVTNFISDNASPTLSLNTSGGSFNLRYNAINTAYEVY